MTHDEVDNGGVDSIILGSDGVRNTPGRVCRGMTPWAKGYTPRGTAFCIPVSSALTCLIWTNMLAVKQ